VSLGPQGKETRSIAIDPASPTTLYTGTAEEGVFKSMTGGVIWEAINTGLTNLNAKAFAIHPTTSTTLYVGTYGGGVFKTTNSGANWEAVNTGLTYLYVWTLALDPTTPTTLYAGTYGGGIFKSTTGGASWEAVNTGLTNLYIYGLALAPTTPTTLYAATNDGGIFKSTTGGASWEAVNTGLTYLEVHCLAHDPTTPTTLYAGTDGGVFKSTTGGANWEAVNTGLTYRYIYAIAVDPASPATVYAGTNDGGVFKSVTGGASWQAINARLLALNPLALALVPTTPTTVYAATRENGVFVLRPSKVGAFRPSDGVFYLDYNGSGTWDGCGTDRCLQIGISGDVPVMGDWTGNGASKVGLFRPADGTFYLDYNGNGAWDGCGTDRCLQIGMNGDVPLVGDWNGDGVAKVGAFRPSDGVFYLDYNGNGVWDGCGTDRCLQIGKDGDIPLVGDWDGSGTAKVGAFRPSDGVFYLDYNGNGVWDGCSTDRCLAIGMSGDTPLVGDWDGSGTAKVGAFRPSDGTFYLDYNGNGQWDGCGTDRCLAIGLDGDTPLVGDWDGTGTAKVGAFRPSDGTFYLDYNGNGAWDGCATDRCLAIGLSGDTPLVGKW
jgi:photosystem II stability/assembly factor-like uncharacterized protein